MVRVDDSLFAGSPKLSLQDVAECVAGTYLGSPECGCGDQDLSCTNTDGSFQCVCVEPPRTSCPAGGTTLRHSGSAIVSCVALRPQCAAGHGHRPGVHLQQRADERAVHGKRKLRRDGVQHGAAVRRAGEHAAVRIVVEPMCHTTTIVTRQGLYIGLIDICWGLLMLCIYGPSAYTTIRDNWRVARDESQHSDSERAAELREAIAAVEAKLRDQDDTIKSLEKSVPQEGSSSTRGPGATWRTSAAGVLPLPAAPELTDASPLCAGLEMRLLLGHAHAAIAHGADGDQVQTSGNALRQAEAGADLDQNSKLASATLCHVSVGSP